ncbi:MAG: hypothetical protein WC992_00210 [Acholeplasmataceae bacterium]
MAFARENLLSGHGPQIPTLVVPQGGRPVSPFLLRDPANPDSPLDCVARLATQDGVDYDTWEASGGSVLADSREHWSSPQELFSAPATAVDALTGSFKVALPAAATAASGLFLLQFSLLNRDGLLVLANAGYLEVQPSLRSAQSRQHLLSVPYLRRRLRDAHPRANRILEECEFTVVEIHDAVVAAVNEFNTTTPVMTSFTETNFPYPLNLVDGVIARLLEMAAIWYERNRVEIAGSGLRVDDMNKAAAYLKLSTLFQERWVRWIKTFKNQANIMNGFNSVPSGLF